MIREFRKGNTVSVDRPNDNDCWNVALAFGLNLKYETVRKRMKKDNGITRTGSCWWSVQTRYMKEFGYERYNSDCKTIRSLADDTQHTEYEYVATSNTHEVYIRYGVIYDSNFQDLIRISDVFRRKISKRRKPIYKLIEKGE